VRGLTRSLLFAVTAAAPLAIAAEEDPFALLDTQLESQFQDLDQQLEAEYEAIDAAIEAAFQRLKTEAEAVWGQDDAALPSQSVWVDYSDDMQARRQFDFEEGVLKIEQIVDDSASQTDLVDSLVASVVEAESDTEADLSEKDAVLNYAKETLAAQDIALSEAPAASNAPVLEGLMALENTEVAASIEKQLSSALQAPLAANVGSEGSTAKAPDQGKEAEASGSGIKVSSAVLSSGAKKVTVAIPFAVDYLSESAQRYQNQVIEEANRRGLPPSLVYAIMETESHFNPRARSHIPAFGLMQLVPSSGGLDAYQYVYGEKLVLGPEYYFNPDQNVELGTAYLDLLLTRYLRAVDNEESRTLCAIAAYNTGAGNVARSFSGGTSVRGAAPLINALEPEAVYEHLIANLPYEETRNYLKKVTKARERYRALDRPSA
jgi:membrane-bound lytic murein transglycosylase C